NFINITIGALFFVLIDVVFNNFYYELKIIHAMTITVGFILYFLLTQPNHCKINLGILSFYAFLLVYLVNIILYTTYHNNFSESLRVLLRFVGCTVIPIVSLGTLLNINLKGTFKVIYYLLAFFLLFTIVTNIPQINLRYYGFNNLSFSSFGYYCSFFSVISMLLFSLDKKIVYLFFIYVGIFLGLLTENRSLIISFLICSDVILFYVNNNIKILKFTAIILIGSVVIFLLNIPIVERFTDLLNLSEVSAIQRLELITLALDNFIKNPIFGS